MNFKQQYKQGTDQAWPQAISFNLGAGSAGVAEVLWRCEAVRGGRVYNSGIFASEAEAHRFAQELRKSEPDKTFNVEKIMAHQIWN